MDINAKDNPYVDEFYRITGDHWTEIQDDSIDLVVWDYVLEHIEFPDKFFQSLRGP